MTRNQAIEIARQRALNARESHGYLPVTEADAQTWMPHEWVIDAILLATMQCDLAAQQPCQYCNDTGDVHGLDGEWQGTCTACKWGAARPAAQPVALTVDEKAALDRALLRSVKIVDEAAQPVAWLVESEPGGLWWDGRFVSRGIDPRFFTRDPNEAIRFARREDAEKVASSSSALKATEHIWLASQPQQAPLKERPDFVAGYDAGLADGRRIAEREQAAQPVAPSDPAAHAVVCVAPNGLERAYDCARSAVADGFSEVGISHVLTGRQKTHGGCVWRLAATKTTPEA